MKRRTMTLLLALCLVFTLLPFAASAEDSTVSVETEHFKVTVTMDPDDAVYNWSMADLGDYFNIPIEIDITAKAATTDLTVDKVVAALKGEEGSRSFLWLMTNSALCLKLADTEQQHGMHFPWLDYQPFLKYPPVNGSTTAAICQYYT